ncbi:MAG TPA: DNA alkylation repair protein [Planctomycetota bacterium]|nr:DNA alkylation repair protein [Planctomycetota bacterium]
MKADEVMKELQRKGNAQTRKTWIRHGCPEPLFGVKVADMKVLMKKTGTDTALAKELFRTGNGDAMYFAGLIADSRELSQEDLDEWARTASWSMISEYSVAWNAAENPAGWELALRWIDSSEDKISAAGWATLGGIMAHREDKDLDLKALERLLDRVVKTIGKAPNRTRYAMNGFVIGAGGSVKALTKKALEAAAKIGEVEVEMGGTSCKVPTATEYIKKIIAAGRHGKKRKMMKC